MSTAVMAACWPLQMSLAAKAVLISLADNANDQGVCWPSIDYIAKRTCMHRASVIRCIQKLEQLGHVVADRSNGRRTTYAITPNLDLFDDAQQGAKRYLSRSATGREEHLNQSRSATEPVAPCDTNHQEPSRTVKGARATRLPKDWQPSEAAKQWFAEEYPGCELKVVVDEFRDYWIALPNGKGVKADWDATFRNSVRKFPPKPRSGPAPAVAGPSPMAGPVRRMTDEERKKSLDTHMPNIAKQLGITSGSQACPPSPHKRH